MKLGLTAFTQQRNQPTMVDQGPTGRNLDARLLGARAPEWQQGPIVWHQILRNPDWQVMFDHDLAKQYGITNREDLLSKMGQSVALAVERATKR
jgi:hypothetical protein